MPPTRSIPSTTQPSVISRTDFALPTGKHLLIITRSRILSWDSSGLHGLFTSSKSSIAAATESKDGSGILAVADAHTVVLHDTKRGQEKSWGLNAEEDQVRHLAYTTDSKNLYISTRVTNAVQCYSTQGQKLLSSPQTLSSPPVALAVSRDGNLMISAEGQPSRVYLKDLVQNTAPTLLQLQASSSAVSVAAFHPERANIFLLGFENGTLAVYDASKLARTGSDGLPAEKERRMKGEVGRIVELHRPTTGKSASGQRAITGAAFIPGYKTRVLSVGTDGRCKLVDFAEGGTLLRAWHAKAPLTSVSVLGLPDEASTVDSRRASRASTNGRPAGYLIAVGSEDGKVMLYDALGLLQTRKKTNDRGEKVMSVEWVDGPSPRPIASAGHPVAAPRDTRVADIPTVDGETPRTRKTSKQPRKSTTPKFLGVHPALRPPGMQTVASPRTSKQFAIHPDEALDSTVRHTPLPGRAQLVSAEAGEYLDLFSPVNPFVVQQQQQVPRQTPSPSRARPRISSQTFTDKNISKTREQGATGSASRRPPLGPNATSSDSRAQKASVKKSVQFKTSHRDYGNSSVKSKRLQGVASNAGQESKGDQSSDVVETVDATVIANARLLRELREMNVKSADKHAGSILQGYAVKMVKGARVGGSRSIEPQAASSQQPAARQAPQTNLAPQELRPTASKSPKQIVDSHIYGRGGRWPTDSVSEASWTDGLEDDIWITSDEESRRPRFHRPHLFHRPPARQTSRSRMDSRGTTSTKPSASTAMAPGQRELTIKDPHQTSTDAFATAHEQWSPVRPLSPASQIVQAAFPRSSSISPHKKRPTPRERLSRSQRGKTERSALRELSSQGANAVNNRLPNSPWDRAKKARSIVMSAPVSGKVDDETLVSGANPDAMRICQGCSDKTGRVEVLESEVVLMKAEILALKAALRRSGIAMPQVPKR